MDSHEWEGHHGRRHGGSFPVEGQRDSGQVMEPGPEDAPAPETHQKEVADDDRREDQGQVNKPVDEGFAREFEAGQQPGDQHTKGETAGHGPEGHPQT